jgi:uncharacterized protein (TIGR00106 family)
VATADLTVLALGRPQTSASEYIAEIQRRLAAQQRVRYRMHAMGTSLEGSTEDILAVVGELHAVPFEHGVPRVYTVLKLDERRDRPDQTLDDKVRSVEERLAGDKHDLLRRLRHTPHALMLFDVRVWGKPYSQRRGAVNGLPLRRCSAASRLFAVLLEPVQ